MSNIHPTAIIDPNAEIGADASIGPYCVIGPQVRLGDGSRLLSHVNLDGNTEIGAECTFYPFCSIGTKTQDLKFRGGNPGVIIGPKTTIREYVTINAATYDGDFTRVGANCLIMAYAHVAHDCIVGDEVIMANCATLAGHVIVEDKVIIGGLSGVHQFVRLGSMSIMGGCSKVIKDVPPYMMADGHPLEVKGLNSEGLKRRNVHPRHRRILKEVYRIIYRMGLTTSDAVAMIEAQIEPIPEVGHILDFIAASERGITK
jgi:UDP-N-acetylglucosamine acyltransferase